MRRANWSRWVLGAPRGTRRPRRVMPLAMPETGEERYAAVAVGTDARFPAGIIVKLSCESVNVPDVPIIVVACVACPDFRRCLSAIFFLLDNPPKFSSSHR
jgi:hypothetical protein